MNSDERRNCMFREMRRKKQQLSEAECAQILERGKTGVLAVVGDGGYPYTVPVNYVYTGGKIYFHGAKTGHKIDAIKADGKVSFCVIDRDDVDAEKMTTLYSSVVLFGRARGLEDEGEIYRAAEVLGLKYNSDRAAVEAEIRREWSGLSCFEITIEHMTGKEGRELTLARQKQK